MTRAPRTEAIAAFIAGFDASNLPPGVLDRVRTLVFDGIGTLAAATHPVVSVGARIGGFAEAAGGAAQASLIGRGRKADLVNVVLANGTLGYACDLEPHHPEAILHPIAVTLPTALALAEYLDLGGRRLLGAVALGCEVTYRLSIALGPKELYALGFHPSAVCGTFGAAAVAAHLLGLDGATTRNALGLAALQASGLMAWEDDPSENARPFQMGMAARNGVTAALLARAGFGAPDRVFDGGHTVLRAFSRSPAPEALVDRLGERWDGVTELAIKPYPCVAFLHPALDALQELIAEHKLEAGQVAAITLRFAASGAHCVDANPLRSHCAQYVLPVVLARGRLEIADLFEDRRLSDPEVARLAGAATVERDQGELERRFPDAYVGDVVLALTDGRELRARGEVARGYPETPLSAAELEAKFAHLVGSVAEPVRAAALHRAATGLADAAEVQTLAALLRQPVDSGAGDQTVSSSRG